MKQRDFPDKLNIAKLVPIFNNVLRVLGTTLQPHEKEPGQRDTTKNHGRLSGIRQTTGHLQNQPCHLPEETGVQLLCAASYAIWCRDKDTDQTNTEQTCGRTDQNGKKYTKIERPTSGSGRGQKSYIYNQHCKINEMFLGRAYQPPQRRPMVLACHHLDTI